MKTDTQSELHELQVHDQVVKRGYRLSDAIRKGAASCEQVKGAWTDDRGARCALGAAVLAAELDGLI